MKQKNKTRLARAAMTLLLALLTTFGAWAQTTTVTIGNGTNTQYYLPINMYYNYSLTQQIYTADEIGTAGTITSISFDYANSASFSMEGVQLYMMNVDKDKFESNTDMVQISAGDKVWEGTFEASEAGWVTIDLDTPFAYDGQSNLLVCFYDPTNGYPGTAYKFRTTATDDNLGIAYYSDGATPSLTDVSTYSGNKTCYQYRTNIILDITSGSVPTCAKPSTFEVSNITKSSAVFEWENTEAGSYTFEYKKASESEWTVVSGLNSNTYSLSSLMPGTAYSARVKAVCGTDLESGYKSVNFTTLLGVPFAEGFATSSIPTGWIKYTGLLSNVQNGGETLSTTSSGWSFGTNNGVFDSHARVNIYGTSCKYWLVTPSLLMENNVQLTFDLALTAYSGTLGTPQTTGTDDKFVVLITTDDGTTWTALRQWDNAGSEYVYNDIACSAVGQNVSIDLSSYAGQNIAIAFYAESTQSNADNNLHIDNVSIDYIPDCAKPTGLTVSNVTGHEATITWTSDADAWQIQLGDNAAIDVTDKTYTFTSLTPETAYSVKVRTNCGGTYSEWTNPVSFTTGIACPVPTNVSTSNITGHGVTVTWDEVEGAMYQCAMVKTAEYNVENITWSESFDTNTQSWNNLDPETSYTFALRKDCSSAEDGYSQIVTKTFTTTIACPAPTGLKTTLTPGDGTVATLSWTEPGDATNWVLEYGTVSDFTGATSVNVSNNPSIALTGLTPETTYYARVKAVCGGEDGESTWSNTVTFIPTNAYSLTVNDGSTTNSYVPVYGMWVDNYSKSQFIIPATELTAMQYGIINKLTFYSSKANVSWGNAEFEVYMTEVDKTTFDDATLLDWATMDKVMNAGSLSISGNKMEVTLDATYQYLGSNLLIGILQTTKGTYSSCYWYGVSSEDNVAIGGYESSKATSNQKFLPKTTFDYTPGTAPTCLKPANLVAGSIDAHSAVLSWTEKGEATQWQICLNDDEDNLIAADTNPFTLTDLNPDTEYSVKVRAYCSADDQSIWSDAVTFTTDVACPAPTNVAVSNVTSTSADISWTGNADATSYNLRYREVDPSTMATVILTAGDVWGDGTGYQMLLDADANAYGTIIPENGGLTTSGDASADTYAEFEFKIPINADGSLSTSNIVLDNSISIQIPAGIYDWCITNPTPNDRVWIASAYGNVPGRNDDYAFEAGKTYEFTVSLGDGNDQVDVTITDGTKAIALGETNQWTTVSDATSPYSITGLTPLTVYEVEVQAVYADGSSAWVGTSFTTDVPYPAPTGLVVEDLGTTTATISWDASDFATGYTYQYKKASVDEWSTETTITGTSVELSGLDDGTAYSFRVKAVYDGGVSTFATITFTTDCLPKDLPYSYDFQNPDELYCWSVLYDVDNPIGIVNSDGNYMFRFSSLNNASSYDQYLISPTLNATSPVVVQFSYKNTNPYNETFKVGYSKTTPEPTEFTWGDEITSSDKDNWTQYMDVFPAGTKYVAIYYYSNYQYYLLVDDFSFTVPESTNITFAKEGYATYYNGVKDVVLPAGMKAHAVSDGGTSLTYAPVADGDTEDYIVPAETAVLLQVEESTENEDMVKPIYLVTNSGAEYSGTNLLHGSDTETTTTGGTKYYKLTYSSNNDNFGWYWGADNGGAFESPAHKAWLALGSSGAPFLGLPGWEDTTGIVPVGVNPEDGEWYTLQGMKVGKKPTTAGVYIHNGRKVLIP